ncbi:MAG: LLM class flavin-dependent oxidoreductase [Spirosomataceae bacterium]
MKPIRIGLIDFGYRSDTLNSLLKLDDVINYCIYGEEMGFDKFWIGEHHMPNRTLTWNNPTNLIPVLASQTQKINIGTAGTLMCLHNPYHVASSFKFYNNIFQNRIELGFANGMPYNGVSMQATGKPNELAVKEFETKVNYTISLLKNEDEHYRNEGIVLPPFKGNIPELWTLGSSESSINRAIKLGTNLCVWTNHDFSAADKERLDKFKEDFVQTHARLPKIRAVVVGVCHPSSKKAKEITIQQNDEGKVPYGSVTKYYEFILKYQEFFKIDDFMFFNTILDPKERLKGIEKLRGNLNLE